MFENYIDPERPSRSSFGSFKMYNVSVKNSKQNENVLCFE